MFIGLHIQFVSRSGVRPALEERGIVKQAMHLYRCRMVLRGAGTSNVQRPISRVEWTSANPMNEPVAQLLKEVTKKRRS